MCGLVFMGLCWSHGPCGCIICFQDVILNQRTSSQRTASQRIVSQHLRLASWHMLGQLAAYKYVPPTPQVGMALKNKPENCPNSQCHPLSMRVRILLLPRVRIQRLTLQKESSKQNYGKLKTKIVGKQYQATGNHTAQSERFFQGSDNSRIY